MPTTLFQPYRLNDTITLNNKILMAPLTRCMADDALVPTQTMANYYGRRAGAGLIISEATIIRPDGQGYVNTPGLYTQTQIEGWKVVTKAVHDKGGKIFAQLWHTGRLAHPHFFGKGEVLSASNIGIEGTIPRMRELTYQQPKTATADDIKQLVADYASAAKNAIEAGFDGVEIHGANGYLIDQFLHYSCNNRTDKYGKTPDNMARFAIEVIDAIIEKIGSDRTAIGLSPGAYFNMEPDNRDRAVFDTLLKQLEPRKLAFIHLGIFDDSMEFDYLDGKASSYLRKQYGQTIVGVGSYTAETGSAAIANNQFDLLAIGRAFIANPDYVSKVRKGLELTAYDDTMLAELI